MISPAGRRARLLLTALLLSALLGCTRDELIVVLPGADGSVGAVTVDTGAGPTLLDQAYAGAELRRGASTPRTVQAIEANGVFGRALAARPILPHHYRLYFVLGSDALTQESALAYRSVFADVAGRAAYEVEVIGHTDTLADEAYNDRLSLARAAAIRDALARDGIAPQSIAIAGRGKRDPLVRTADQVAEPANRRVEITVR
jgi:outer membrane protein OmpA-like peptidoglycan-associated protein